MRRIRVKGSYTVEAALLLPCIIVFVIALIYLGFYIHDKTRIQAIINETEARGRVLVRSESHMVTGVMNYESYDNRGIFYYVDRELEDKREAIKVYIEEKLSRGLFITDITKLEITVSQSKIHIRVTAGMEIPFVQVKELFAGAGLTVVIENTAYIQNQMEFIRVFEIFSGAASKTEAGDQALTKLQDRLNTLP